MIKKSGNNTGSVYKGTTEYGEIRRGTTLVWEGWKTLTAEGVPPITLQKCKSTDMLGYKVYGNSKQPTYTGKNLWDKVSSYTGGTTEQIESNALNSSKTYTISFDVSSDYAMYGNNTYIFSLRLNGSGRINIESNALVAGTRYTKTFNTIDLVRFTNQQWYRGTLSNIMIEEGSTATEYEPGVPSPTPDYPSEIQSVGDKTKNLWNSTLIAGCMKFADGQYLNYPGYVCNATPILVEAGETYTISANNYDDPEQTSTGFVFYNNGTFVSSLITTSLTVTIPTGVNQLYYDFRKQSSASSLSPSDITNVQLEKGSSATSYEPYGYKVPIKVSGKNLFNSDTFTNSGKLLDPTNGSLNTNTNYKTSNLIFITSGTYTLSLKNTYDGTGNTTTRICLYNLSNTYTGTAVSDTSFRPANPTYTFTITSDCYYRLSVRNTDENVMIEKGNPATSYEPYYTPRTTDIYLNAPLRKIGDGVPQILPSGYTQLEYIQSTGTQYIDTGIVANQDTSTDLDFQLTSTDRQKGIYGIYETEIKSYYIYTGRDGIFQVGFGGGRYVDTQFAIDLNRHKVNFKDFKITIDNTVVSTYTKSSVSYTQTQLLFNMHKADGTTYNGASVKIYSCKIYNNNVLVRNFIPAKNSSNVVGMYDLVNNVFYTNQGTGTFTAGPEIYADYIDLETQKVYRNVGHIDLGSPTYTYQSQYSRFRSDTISGLKIITGNWTYALMSDIYGNTLAVNYNIGAQGGALFIWDNRYTDPTALKTALTGHYLDFALGTTGEESITLPDILLNKGTNIVSVDTTTTPSKMWIKYKGKE